MAGDQNLSASYAEDECIICKMLLNTSGDRSACPFMCRPAFNINSQTPRPKNLHDFSEYFKSMVAVQQPIIINNTYNTVYNTF